MKYNVKENADFVENSKLAPTGVTTGDGPAFGSGTADEPD